LRSPAVCRRAAASDGRKRVTGNGKQETGDRGVVASRFLLPVSVLSCLLTPRLVAQYTGLVCKVKSLYMLPGRHGSDALRTDVDGPADRGIRPAVDRAPAARPATVLPCLSLVGGDRRA